MTDTGQTSNIEGDSTTGGFIFGTNSSNSIPADVDIAEMAWGNNLMPDSTQRAELFAHALAR